MLSLIQIFMLINTTKLIILFHLILDRNGVISIGIVDPLAFLFSAVSNSELLKGKKQMRFPNVFYVNNQICICITHQTQKAASVKAPDFLIISTCPQWLSS